MSGHSSCGAGERAGERAGALERWSAAAASIEFMIVQTELLSCSVAPSIPNCSSVASHTHRTGSIKERFDQVMRNVAGSGISPVQCFVSLYL